MAVKKGKVVDKNGRKITYDIKENGKMNTGRPTKITDTVIKELEESFKKDCTVKEACFKAGISTVAFYERMKNDRKFTNKMQLAITSPFYKARTNLQELMDSEKEEIKLKSTLEFLSRRDRRYSSKAEYTDKSEIEAYDESQENNIKNKNMLDLEEMRKNMLGF